MAHYAILDENNVVTQVIVGKDETAMAIREYARTNSAKGIMIQDESTGTMTYLKLPKGKTGVQF